MFSSSCSILIFFSSKISDACFKSILLTLFLGLLKMFLVFRREIIEYLPSGFGDFVVLDLVKSLVLETDLDRKSFV